MNSGGNSYVLTQKAPFCPMLVGPVLSFSPLKAFFKKNSFIKIEMT